MCGIAGVISWSPKYRVTRDLLRAMSAKIAHRGPDGEGLFLTRENEDIDESRPQAGLAFRRLAILDPDPRAMQPFTIGHQTIVFNGEIYNFRELRQELTKIRPDYAWRTTGDTEVLLLSYATWGEKCLEKLNGMFAIAVWDEEKKELFLARDRMGQKPLYMVFPASENVVSAFASEISPLLGLPFVERKISDRAMRDYLRFGHYSGSIYSGIGELAPGTWARVSPARVQQETFFKIDPTARSTMDDETAAGGARERVICAVSRQLVSDVPLGCFLSGGIDSSVVAASMREALPAGQSIMTFCAAFADQRYDESPYAEGVARHLGTIHKRFIVEPNAAEDIPKIAAIFAEPFGDSSALPTYYLSKSTREHVKVCLSGDGGDELFGGYDRYLAMRWSRRVGRFATPATARRIENMIASSLEAHPKSLSVRVRRFLAGLGLPDDLRYQSYMCLDGRSVELLADSESKLSGPALYSCAFDRDMRNFGDVVLASLATDRGTYLPFDLLAKVDRCSMAHALEVRSPFMDHELVQFAAGLTTDQLLKGGPKRMLREAFAADLPDFVFKRKKMGFAVPIGDWLRNELRPMLHDHLFAANSFARAHFNLDVVRRLIDEHESHRVDHSQRLYALLMLELWHAAFNRGTP